MSSLESENYHLKWDSHMSFLNTSIATLYKNIKFADVILFSSCPEAFVRDGDNDDMASYEGGILAHKFILSCCSHFFASILESTPSVPNGIMHIVLPSDISRLVIQILVQYMYTGEVTVSNSILNEVLRGGEILKIRGLCRTSNSTSMTATKTTTSTARGNNSGGGSNQTIINEFVQKAYDRWASKMVKGPNTTRTVNNENRNEFRSFGGSVVSKENPFALRSSKLTQPQPNLDLLPVTNQYVPIHPVTESFSSFFKPQRICAIANCRDCYNERSLPGRSFDLNSARRQSEEIVRQITIPHAAASNSEHTSPIIKEEPNKWQIETRNRSGLGSVSNGVGGAVVSSGNNTVQAIKNLPSTIATDTNNITTTSVKQEYRDTEDVNRSSLLTDRANTVPISEGKCDRCNKTFVDFNLWLSHIQSHTETIIDYPPYIPTPSTSTTAPTSSNGNNVQQKASDEQAVALLKCDICKAIFTTRADWVRHTQFAHTESELDVWNNSQDLRLKHKRNTSTDSSTSSYRNQDKETYNNYWGKSCDICHRKFPTYTTMLNHRRTHI